jgi:hypothetical protein
VGEPDALGLRGVDVAAGEDDVRSARRPDEARQEVRHAGVGAQPAAHVAGRHRGARGDEAQVAGERQPEARAGRGSVDGGDHRLLAVAHREHPAPHPGQRVEAPDARALVGHRRLGEVEPRAEAAPRAGDHDDAHVVVAPERVERRRQLLGQPGIHGVEPLGAVEGERAHAGGRALQAQVLVGHGACGTRERRAGDATGGRRANEAVTWAQHRPCLRTRALRYSTGGAGATPDPRHPRRSGPSMSTTSSAPGAAVVEPRADENGRDPIATFYLRATRSTGVPPRRAASTSGSRAWCRSRRRAPSSAPPERS